MRNSKIGKIHSSREFIKSIPDDIILVEAAIRRGQPLSELIKPMSPSQAKMTLKRWKDAKASALNADYPDMNPMYEMYDDEGIDLFLSSTIQTRILRVQQSKFVWVDKDKKANEDANTLFKKQWFLDFLKFAMQSIFEHFRLIELFDIDQNGELKKCKVVNKYNVKSKKGIVTKETYDETGIDYLSGPISMYYLPVGDPNELGLLFKVVPIILAIKSALGQWSEFNEKLGIPFRTVTTNAGDSKRQQQLAVIMEEMGSAGWAVLNENEKVELLAINGSNPTQCFKELINLLDARIATYMLGQSSTTDSSKNKGTYGSMAILQEISEIVHQSDLTFIEYLVNDELKNKLIALSSKYQILSELKFEWDKSIDLTVKETVDYVVALSDIYEIDPKYVSEKTGIPILGLKKQSSPGTLPPTPPIKKKSPLKADLKAFYGNVCCQGHDVILASSLPSFDDDILRIAKAIFEGKQKGIVDIPLIKKTAAYLQQGITSGFGTTTDATDKAMLESLTKNVQLFSGFKTYDQLLEITNLLKDENGKQREWPAFKNEVLKSNKDYNVNYLKAEYDQANVGSQMASYWQEIQRNKDTLPYLKFVATNDSRTTAICKSLDGFTARVDDPIWLQYFLPLHWHERSNIIQLADAVESNKSDFKFMELQPMFKNNIGITGVAFPSTHPYFDTSVKVKNEITNAVNIAAIQSTRDDIRTWSKSAIKEFGEKYKINNDEFDTLTLRRGDVKTITGKPHAQAVEAYKSILDISTLFKEANYLGSSPDIKKGEKGHGTVIKWLYYEVEIASETSYLNVMQTNTNEYRLHSISDKQGFSKKKIKNKPKK